METLYLIVFINFGWIIGNTSDIRRVRNLICIACHDLNIALCHSGEIRVHYLGFSLIIHSLINDLASDTTWSCNIIKSRSYTLVDISERICTLLFFLNTELVCKRNLPFQEISRKPV